MKSILINGTWQSGEGIQITSVNPANHEVVWQKNGASAEQVKFAIDAARSAQHQWALTPIEKRIEILQKFAELLREHANELAKIISLETGKPDWEALTEVNSMANKVAISISSQNDRANTENGYQGLAKNLRLSHRPHGVMAVYGPYNFPGHLPNGHIVPALLAGNTIVFKPSEETPYTAEKTVELWQLAGLPDGVMNLVQGAKEVGVALAKQEIDGLLFTGSSTTGQILHRQFAGKPEVLLALEMGGNNPLIVDSQVNMQTAINIVLQSAFLSAGQRCTCARRLIVVRDDNTAEFVSSLSEHVTRLIAGLPSDQPEPFMGPVINPQTAQLLFSAQQTLLDLGGISLNTMSLINDTSNLLNPGLIDMTNAQPAPDEEWFGPLLQLYVVDSFTEALALANNTQFGLAAGLVSDNEQHQHIFAHSIKAGVISINQPTAGASSELPFGGIGASGNHRPSAIYAADYCAWPQALSQGAFTHEQTNALTRGVK